jgi:tetratricopeptide (TPR) repeat protein
MLMADFNYDVFLSHSSTDKPLVEELARRLERQNLRPWLDWWNLIPGTPWMPAIERALADCAACAVIIGPGGFGLWHHEEMRAAISRHVNDRERPFRVIPVLLPGAEPPELPPFLVATTWVIFNGSLDDPDAFRRLVCGIRGIEPRPGVDGAPLQGQNPYRGLELFDVEHAPLFFGREELTERLLDALKRRPAMVENRFQAIIGASGSGKSSLARAGLLAALKAGKVEGSADWSFAICRPGPDPFLSLATALTTLAPLSVSSVVFDRLQGRKDRERSVHVAAGLVLGEPPRAERLVLLVDQFEEIFTLCSDELARRDFIANLLHASIAAGGRTIVVLSMRADFYPRCAAYADLAAALSHHQVLVGPMTDDELHRAIERPARLAGLEPEPGLVERLVDDIRGRPGALPLLQFALQELWRRCQAHRLTNQAYREIGEIEGALERKADAVYAGFLPEEQKLCRRIFLRLVQPGEGNEDTRRRASLREVLPDDPTQAEAVRKVITRLADPEARLVTTTGQRPAGDDSTLEVVHEALIRGWPQLRKWVDADRAGLRTHRRMTEAAEEWADAKPEAKESLLYTGARLAVSAEWAAAHPDDLSPLESEFLAKSRRRHADALEAERRRSRRLFWLAGGLAGVSLLAVGLAVTAFLGWNKISEENVATKKAERIANELLIRSYIDAAQLATDRGDWQKAVDWIDKALDKGPDSVELHLGKLKALVALDEIKKARLELDELNRRTDLGPLEPQVLLWRSDLGSDKQFDIKGRIGLLHDALNKGLRGADAAYARGLLAKSSAEAISEFRAALAIEPFHQRAIDQLGWLLAFLGYHQEATELLAKTELLFREDPGRAAIRAFILASRGQTKQAESTLDRVKDRIDPAVYARWEAVNRFVARYSDTDDQPLNQPGGILEVMRQVIAALAFLNEVKGLFNELESAGQYGTLDFPIHFRQSTKRLFGALLPLSFGNSEPMIRELEAAESVVPMGALALFRGILLFRNGRNSEAEMAMNKAAELPSMVRMQRLARISALVVEDELLGADRSNLTPELRGRALKNIRALHAMGMTDPMQARYLINAAVAFDDVDLGRSILCEWERRDPVSPEPRTARAYVEFMSGAYSPAYCAAMRAIRAHPRSHEAENIRITSINACTEQARLFRASDASAPQPPSAQYFLDFARDHARTAANQKNLLWLFRRVHADLAMLALWRASEQGWLDVAVMAHDPAFETLRSRADFKEMLLFLMDDAFPVDPFAPIGKVGDSASTGL